MTNMRPHAGDFIQPLWMNEMVGDVLLLSISSHSWENHLFELIRTTCGYTIRNYIQSSVAGGSKTTRQGQTSSRNKHVQGIQPLLSSKYKSCPTYHLSSSMSVIHIMGGCSLSKVYEVTGGRVCWFFILQTWFYTPVKASGCFNVPLDLGKKVDVHMRMCNVKQYSLNHQL